MSFVYSSILQVKENRRWIDMRIRNFISHNEMLFVSPRTWENTWRVFQPHLYGMIGYATLTFEIYEYHKGILKLKIFPRDRRILRPSDEEHFEYNMIQVIREEKIKTLFHEHNV